MGRRPTIIAFIGFTLTAVAICVPMELMTPRNADNTSTDTFTEERSDAPRETNERRAWDKFAVTALTVCPSESKGKNNKGGFLDANDVGRLKEELDELYESGEVDKFPDYQKLDDVSFSTRNTRAAFVVGIDHYDEEALDLKNAVNDAIAVAVRLYELKFDVFLALGRRGTRDPGEETLGRKEFARCFTDFGTLIEAGKEYQDEDWTRLETLHGKEKRSFEGRKISRKYEVAVTYLTGHGLEVEEGAHFMVADSNLAFGRPPLSSAGQATWWIRGLLNVVGQRGDVAGSMVSIKKILGTLETQMVAWNRDLHWDGVERFTEPLKIIILDACRTSPYDIRSKKGWLSNIVAGVLRPDFKQVTRAGKGDGSEEDEFDDQKRYFVGYSTSGKSVAKDGLDGSHHSPFTTAFLTSITDQKMWRRDIVDTWHYIVDEIEAENERAIRTARMDGRGRAIDERITLASPRAADDPDRARLYPFSFNATPFKPEALAAARQAEAIALQKFEARDYVSAVTLARAGLEKLDYFEDREIRNPQDARHFGFLEFILKQSLLLTNERSRYVAPLKNLVETKYSEDMELAAYRGTMSEGLYRGEKDWLAVSSLNGAWKCWYHPKLEDGHKGRGQFRLENFYFQKGSRKVLAAYSRFYDRRDGEKEADGWKYVPLSGEGIDLDDFQELLFVLIDPLSSRQVGLGDKAQNSTSSGLESEDDLNRNGNAFPSRKCKSYSQSLTDEDLGAGDGSGFFSLGQSSDKGWVVIDFDFHSVGGQDFLFSKEVFLDHYTFKMTKDRSGYALQHKNRFGVPLIDVKLTRLSDKSWRKLTNDDLVAGDRLEAFQLPILAIDNGRVQMEEGSIGLDDSGSIVYRTIYLAAKLVESPGGELGFRYGDLSTRFFMHRAPAEPNKSGKEGGISYGSLIVDSRQLDPGCGLPFRAYVRAGHLAVGCTSQSAYVSDRIEDDYASTRYFLPLKLEDQRQGKLPRNTCRIEVSSRASKTRSTRIRFVGRETLLIWGDDEKGDVRPDDPAIYTIGKPASKPSGSEIPVCHSGVQEWLKGQLDNRDLVSISPGWLALTKSRDDMEDVKAHVGLTPKESDTFRVQGYLSHGKIFREAASFLASRPSANNRQVSGDRSLDRVRIVGRDHDNSIHVWGVNPVAEDDDLRWQWKSDKNILFGGARSGETGKSSLVNFYLQADEPESDIPLIGTMGTEAVSVAFELPDRDLKFKLYKVSENGSKLAACGWKDSENKSEVILGYWDKGKFVVYPLMEANGDSETNNNGPLNTAMDAECRDRSFGFLEERSAGGNEKGGSTLFYMDEVQTRTAVSKGEENTTSSQSNERIWKMRLFRADKENMTALSAFPWGGGHTVIENLSSSEYLVYLSRNKAKSKTIVAARFEVSRYAIQNKKRDMEIHLPEELASIVSYDRVMVSEGQSKDNPINPPPDVVEIRTDHSTGLSALLGSLANTGAVKNFEVKAALHFCPVRQKEWENDKGGKMQTSFIPCAYLLDDDNNSPDSRQISRSAERDLGNDGQLIRLDLDISSEGEEPAQRRGRISIKSPGENPTWLESNRVTMISGNLDTGSTFSVVINDEPGSPPEELALVCNSDQGSGLFSFSAGSTPDRQADERGKKSNSLEVSQDTNSTRNAPPVIEVNYRSFPLLSRQHRVRGVGVKSQACQFSRDKRLVAAYLADELNEYKGIAVWDLKAKRLVQYIPVEKQEWDAWKKKTKLPVDRKFFEFLTPRECEGSKCARYIVLPNRVVRLFPMGLELLETVEDLLPAGPAEEVLRDCIDYGICDDPKFEQRSSRVARR